MSRKLHRSYWRGVWRHARKETREFLFGSRERALVTVVTTVVYIAIAVALFGWHVVQMDAYLGVLAGAAPLLLYPLIFAWKMATIPPRLHRRAYMRGSVLRQSVATLKLQAAQPVTLGQQRNKYLCTLAGEVTYLADALRTRKFTAMFEVYNRDIYDSSHPVWTEPELNELRYNFLVALGKSRRDASSNAALKEVRELAQALSESLLEKANHWA